MPVSMTLAESHMKKTRKTLLVVGGTLLLVLVAGAVYIAWCKHRLRPQLHTHACWEYLNLIASTKEYVALPQGLTNGTSLAWADLERDLARPLPHECHSGGQFEIGAVGLFPSCSIHGQSTGFGGAGLHDFLRRNGIVMRKAETGETQ